MWPGCGGSSGAASTISEPKCNLNRICRVEYTGLEDEAAATTGIDYERFGCAWQADSDAAMDNSNVQCLAKHANGCNSIQDLLLGVAE